MAKFKVSYKLLKQAAQDLETVSKEVIDHMDALEKVGNNLQDESVLTGVKRSLLDGSAKLNEYMESLKTISKSMTLVVEKYTATENNNSKKMDSARAHNRDFYKNAVSVPSASVGSSGGGGAAVTAAPTATTAAATVVNVNVGGADMGGSGSVQSPAATTAGYTPVSSSGGTTSGATFVPSGSAGSAAAASGGMGTAATAGAAAVVGAAAVAGGVAAAAKSKKKKAAAAQGAAPTPAMVELDKAERKLAEAMEKAKAPS